MVRLKSTSFHVSSISGPRVFPQNRCIAKSLLALPGEEYSFSADQFSNLFNLLHNSVLTSVQSKHTLTSTILLSKQLEAENIIFSQNLFLLYENKNHINLNIKRGGKQGGLNFSPKGLRCPCGSILWCEEIVNEITCFSSFYFPLLAALMFT